MTIPDPLLDALRRSRLRPTRSRAAVIEALVDAGAPLTTVELIARVASRGVPSSTVYGTLVNLSTAGILRRLDFGEDHARFEIAEEFGGHHHHFVCRGCARVDDLDEDPRIERALGRLAEELSGGGRTIDGHRLDLIGTCAACRR